MLSTGYTMISQSHLKGKKVFYLIRFQTLTIKNQKTRACTLKLSALVIMTCGLHYKSLTIVIYNGNDSGQYYKTTITAKAS